MKELLYTTVVMNSAPPFPFVNSIITNFIGCILSALLVWLIMYCVEKRRIRKFTIRMIDTLISQMRADECKYNKINTLLSSFESIPIGDLPTDSVWKSFKDSSAIIKLHDENVVARLTAYFDRISLISESRRLREEKFIGLIQSPNPNPGSGPKMIPLANDNPLFHKFSSDLKTQINLQLGDSKDLIRLLEICKAGC